MGGRVDVGTIVSVGVGRGVDVAGGGVAVETRAATEYDGLETLPKRSGPIIKRAPTAPTINIKKAKINTARANVMRKFPS